MRGFNTKNENYIKANYLDISIKELSRKLECSQCKVSGYLKRNNLIIPKEILEARRKSSYFKKGQVPHNKNLKITQYTSSEKIERMKKTQFKKGNKPHNTRSVGEIVKRKETNSDIYYNYIKIADNHFELLQRYNWENVNGKIPNGHVIAFKDGNTDNCSINNLECICKAELMFRNTRHNYHKDIIPTLLLRSKLNKKLKQLKNAK